jgi:hypothetical protein
MTRIEQLTALRDAVRDGVWPGWADTPMGWDTNLLWKAFNGSVDAALAMFAALLPGWDVVRWDQASNLAGSPWGCEVGYFDGSNPSKNRKAYSGHDYPDPARALLLAVLEALIAKEEG